MRGGLMAGILGIENRTENWRTAVYFSPMFGGKSYQLPGLLGATTAFLPNEVTIELFWKGVRDYRYKEGILIKDLERMVGEAYELNFSNLRRDVLRFQEFAELDAAHYESGGEKARSRLTNNVLGTEIDVVLETPDHLFIGEVKHESTFGADGKLVLVHQLVRQFVAATILLHIAGERKEVVPFVVGDSTHYLKKTSQVRFMIDQDWLREANVLDWEDVERAHVV
jgi:hypothetical protein